jgi:5-methyltetrahydropteroyltriglutamate--homocysteine methyltransferase
MDGIEFMKDLPKDKGLQVGIVDIRTNMIESPKALAERIKKVVGIIPPDRLTLSTDCGMKPLARMVAKMKLKALAEAAAMVRTELMGTR